MATITIYDQTKKEVGSMDLAPEVFEVPVKPEILNLVVRAQLAAKRSGTHATKTRAMKRGGGAKPWRQKGTGRARAGSTRSPLWRGGGVTFGPQPRDYSFKVNKKVRRLALKMALTSRFSEEQLMIIKDIDLPEIKTKLFAQVAETLGLYKALIIVKDADNKLLLSARNIPGIKMISADQINVYDILRHRQVVMLENAAQDLQERLK
ncbi:50S ribosomal protein L4 [Maridesulfovibrio ferrireducens]|uniref:Large ribosomal subunit protein uL4 n=1 Tax=Maridesulfovibrio ferrireducens TaxID=246191 RepID=A0A1G9F7X3_9BACT|nr:50S ribosomal protein L4 [Maridesulfovibrio ferrireducens]MBI9110972.1 50S ribosomal protein L4 [Maridesulfovibrio ferrireducens]SDK84263.1 large subunit ribosomal protein L4 [Maridesulfovibrio ferrireducens]